MILGPPFTHCMCFPLGHHFMYMDPALTPRSRTQTEEVKGLHYQ